ncbi:hypothetical protein GUJ93_ZPchr0001g30237 [Zizania palustris]|uniref:Uncharacterized protein n=1 Tax=Zizania palustris TaxID=103762 RepID=A0A8J5VAH9_ZIZPA|nr:hypothetical protein GUJ93_ZPchr0001g30237 [Zizania palustris]
MRYQQQRTCLSHLHHADACSSGAWVQPHNLLALAQQLAVRAAGLRCNFSSRKAIKTGLLSTAKATAGFGCGTSLVRDPLRPLFSQGSHSAGIPEATHGDRRQDIGRVRRGYPSSYNKANGARIEMT